jgi:thiol-disulfide isomerase/thioredoxin
MKIKTLILFLFILTIYKVEAQSPCFSNCKERAVVEWEKLKARGVTSTDSALTINYKILSDLKGCAFPNATLSKLDDTKLFVHFWFTNCATCLAEIPSINQLNKEYKNKKVKFLAISFNDKTTINAFLKKHGSFESIQTTIEQKILENTFCVLDGYPLNLVLDKNGNVIDAWYEENPNSTMQNTFYKKTKELIDKNL